ncbi:hypothetical protein JW890_00445 [candidate division WOR-3 bacterium]|nr:hypothetical protein [candidate division WOR-3 bacterium]
MMINIFKNKILLVAGGIVFGVLFALFFGIFVKILWNWLMPELFSLPRISYWQAWGLVLLSHIFFKNTEHRFRSNNRDNRKPENLRQKIREHIHETHSAEEAQA